jgi:hypothetical protein
MNPHRPNSAEALREEQMAPRRLSVAEALREEQAPPRRLAVAEALRVEQTAPRRLAVPEEIGGKTGSGAIKDTVGALLKCADAVCFCAWL